MKPADARERRDERPDGTPLRLTWKWRSIALLVIALVNLCRWRVRVHDLHHVPPRDGAVLAFNHHSYLDFVMVAWAPVRRLRRPVRFLAKREIWGSRWLGWLVRAAEAVPVDRQSSVARAGAFDAAAAALRRGDLVAVAPEQTISRSFELLPLRTGAVRMAQAAGVPVVPVVGWGSQRIATKGRLPRPAFGTPVVVRYGPPLHVGADEDPVAATARLAAAMDALLDEVVREYVDGTPAGAWWVPARHGGGAPDHAEVVRDHTSRTRRWDGGSGGQGDATP
ncbi:lysophospholipid acyltransferase family protein [Egicoccus halophilus]|uniref:1-acyl-sn-glycerol-3-phosphate acyltransferase n=1 Tax=Egicoccus halophilus TaxID=1670830 RepID=A0A8J3AF03_9ACTN|nr:lysophospholipid acyltransferase family protein [Egicoccus halophilus]GGI06218.1 1-acyl-sn-glycerol-3-phosphate acyltransferase [Egicoccus halophilus]